MEYRREIALVYTVEEALAKLNIIRGHGFSEHEIHLFSKDIRPFQSLKMYTDIQIHTAGNWMDQLISFITRQNVYEASLRILHLTPEEAAHYGHGIELGAIFIIAEHEHPYEKEPKKRQAAFNMSNAVD
ncbi:general stress protein [Solibacillus silvestris]|uniref:general stress protein n=1 Tax=Solibacillus silvestris TaxID=76853 RepID=UPI003F7EA4CD